ncbi:SDR family NAD(P)-dependent oxidoreductase [Streptomyces sp. NPDC052040]|uniref:SDR family NAD(P)-dependent oxidoreductase n=1 Tax=unclassified Streptomyces TaxID=2593676 RepID=UPI0037CED2F2
MRHDGTTAVVTGASSGFGAEFARQLAQRGADVVLVARRADRLTALGARLRERYGVTAHTLEHDLNGHGAAERLAAELAARGIAVDTLVNCAGVGTRGGFATEDAAAISRELQLNITALVELTRALLPQMLASGRGALVNVASTAAYQPTPSMAVYGASKAFVLSFTEALVHETRANGLRVLALSPGPTRTEFFDVLGTHKPAVGPMSGPQQVVRTAMRALDRRSTPASVIAGLAHALPVAAARLAPRRVVLSISGRLLGA